MCFTFLCKKTEAVEEVSSPATIVVVFLTASYVMVETTVETTLMN